MDTDAWNTISEWWQWLQTNDYFTAALKYVASFTVGHKVVLLLLIIYVTLRIIGRVNGIKRSTYFDDMAPALSYTAPEGALRLPKARFPDERVLSYYIDLSCTVNFWDPAKFPNWISRKILRRKAPVRGTYKLIILTDKTFNSNNIGVDQHTREALLTKIQKPSSPDATLDGTRWKVELKKDNTVRFLLKHPDSTIRTTAWVVLATSILALVQTILFEKPSLTPPG